MNACALCDGDVCFNYFLPVYEGALVDDSVTDIQSPVCKNCYDVAVQRAGDSRGRGDLNNAND